MDKTIVHVLDSFPSRSETFIVNHIIECERKGFQSVILCNTLKSIDEASQPGLIQSFGLYKKAKSYNSAVPNNKILRSLKAVLVLLKNFRHYKVFFRTLNQKKFGLKAKTLKLWFQAGLFLNYKNYKTLHAHFGINGKLLAEMKAIGAVNGNIITSFYGYDTFSAADNRAHLKMYYKDVFLSSKKIITSSNYLHSNLKKLAAPKDKLIVNAVGVDLTKFPYQERVYNRVLNVITVGRLIKLKGQHLGIEAVSVLLQKGYTVNYTILGSGEEYDNLKTLILNSEYKDNFRLTEGGSQAEVCSLLHKSHVFLMTSVTDDTGRAEGQGLVIAEAQATGLPIVAFDSGGVSDSIKDHSTGFLVKENNVNDMAEKLELFFTKPKLINDMGRKAHDFVTQNFDSQKQSDNLIQHYN
jgi:colanic acid/amylovoran biosynthesis glycosyltransferase